MKNLITIDGIIYDLSKVDSHSSVWKLLTDKEKSISIKLRNVINVRKRTFGPKRKINCSKCGNKFEVITTEKGFEYRDSIRHLCKDCVVELAKFKADCVSQRYMRKKVSREYYRKQYIKLD